MSRAYVIGTLDTKGDELRYVADVVRSAGQPVVVVDVGTGERGRAGTTGADVTAAEVAAHHPDGADAVWSDDRGRAVTAMSEALVAYVTARADDVGGIIGAAGSGGTALVTPAMRALPVGVPKVMVSTVASGDVGPYVGPADIAMMYSGTVVAGLNRISRVVLGYAGRALAGMLTGPVPGLGDAGGDGDDLPAVGLTMFGVTTPLVTRLVAELADRFDPLVFHATGTGGRSMEKLVDSGMIGAVVDMTTTEIADHLVGGVFSAGPDRLGAIARTRVPYVGSVGALDMVNFGARDTVPDRFDGRLLHVHNSQVTLMRTTVEENVAIGTFIAEALNRCAGPVRFLLPVGGVSMLDAPGQPFHDPEADEALFTTIERLVESSDDRVVARVDAHINDDRFADAVLEHLAGLLAVAP
jgi:uncharacterized protein (UPF0261 family)